MSKLPSAARRLEIKRSFAARPSVSVGELAREHEVSEMTIRRDLAALAAGLEKHLQSEP